MSNYTQVTDFSAKDGLTTGDAEKAISGADVDGEFSKISTAVATKIDKPGSPTTDDLLVWSGSAWAAKDIGVDGTDGQIYRTNGTISSWGSAHSVKTETATTSGVTVSYTSIPSWVTRICIMFDEVSTSGSSDWGVRIGTGGAATTSGYVAASMRLAADGSNVANAGVTAGFEAFQVGGSNTITGTAWLTLQDAANTWTFISQGMRSSANMAIASGRVSLGGALDIVQIYTANGSDTFDSGSFNISYS